MCLRQYTEDACKYLRDTNRRETREKKKIMVASLLGLCTVVNFTRDLRSR